MAMRTKIFFNLKLVGYGKIKKPLKNQLVHNIQYFFDYKI
tara:strand:- start:54264 stop:54383 length:120 start_codon:yes stop_codon:yes gene_type:complete